MLVLTPEYNTLSFNGLMLNSAYLLSQHLFLIFRFRIVQVSSIHAEVQATKPESKDTVHKLAPFYHFLMSIELSSTSTLEPL